MTLYKKIAGGQIITQSDFDNNAIKANEWYAINSDPHYPTHTLLGGVLMTFSEADAIGERELLKSHPELNP